MTPGQRLRQGPQSEAGHWQREAQSVSESAGGQRLERREEGRTTGCQEGGSVTVMLRPRHTNISRLRSDLRESER